MAHSAETHPHDAHHADGEFAHPMSVGMLMAIFLILVALTGLTVYQSTLQLGAFEVWASLIIATVKAGLVICFFMHLLYDKPLNAILFTSSLIFVSLFLGFTLMDAHEYKNQIEIVDTLKESLPAIAQTDANAPAGTTPPASGPTPASGAAPSGNPNPATNGPTDPSH